MFDSGGLLGFSGLIFILLMARIIRARTCVGRCVIAVGEVIFTFIMTIKLSHFFIHLYIYLNGLFEHFYQVPS